MTGEAQSSKAIAIVTRHSLKVFADGFLYSSGTESKCSSLLVCVKSLSYYIDLILFIPVLCSCKCLLSQAVLSEMVHNNCSLTDCASSCCNDTVYAYLISSLNILSTTLGFFALKIHPSGKR